MQKINRIKYEKDSLKEHLHEPMQCHHCNTDFDNRFADLKRHLEGEWQKLERDEQAKADAKEKFLEQQAIRKAKREQARLAAGGEFASNEAGTAEVSMEAEE